MKEWQMFKIRISYYITIKTAMTEHCGTIYYTATGKVNLFLFIAYPRSLLSGRSSATVKDSIQNG